MCVSVCCSNWRLLFSLHILLLTPLTPLTARIRIGGSPGYVFELTQSINTCIQEIVVQLTTMGERTDAVSKNNQARLVLDLVSQISARMELTLEVGEFLMRLLDLAMKTKSTMTRVDLRFLSNTLEHVKQKAADNPQLLNALKQLA